MNIAILTSSRADYGIYLPLLQKLKKDSFFNLEIIAFGTHLSKKHGFTLSDIVNDGYDTIHEITSLVEEDSEKGIAISYANTVLSFADFWAVHKFDLVFCLGDRFEMSAAVQASIPFGVKLVHLHGGETTLGAIDNIYRHQISLASQIHFVASDAFLSKLREISGNSKKIYNVGALSLDGIKKIDLPDWSDVRKLFDIPNKEFILITFHPETINPNQNKIYIKTISKVLNKLCEKYHLIITMSNADTMGSLYRKSLKELKIKNPNNITLIENFGKYNYFAAMKASKILLGNTSSAILEAASFGKYAINLGNRQLGRLRSDNVLDVPYNKTLIISAVNEIINQGLYTGENKYYKPNTALNIIKIIKENEL
jgi:GDP/UDP-N,N'-diacetylbacillosamine 2-epimerase (hydrolysing)